MKAWYPYKLAVSRYRLALLGDDQVFEVPDESREVVEAVEKPPGDWWGPFHCAECAVMCGSFGKVEAQAWDFVHGSEDAKFGVFLVA